MANRNETPRGAAPKSGPSKAGSFKGSRFKDGQGDGNRGPRRPAPAAAAANPDARHRPISELGPMVEALLTDMGYDLVRLQLSRADRPVLQVMAERTDRSPMGVDDCAGISRALSALFDVEDPVPGAYSLEVSSPGLDRPLVRLADYERFKGFMARIETRDAIDGRKRFQGNIIGVEDETIRLELDGGTVDLPFHEIAKSKLVLTDELIAAAQEAGLS